MLPGERSHLPLIMLPGLLTFQQQMSDKGNLFLSSCIAACRHSPAALTSKTVLTRALKGWPSWTQTWLCRPPQQQIESCVMLPAYLAPLNLGCSLQAPGGGGGGGGEMPALLGSQDQAAWRPSSSDLSAHMLSWTPPGYPGGIRSGRQRSDVVQHGVRGPSWSKKPSQGWQGRMPGTKRRHLRESGRGQQGKAIFQGQSVRRCKAGTKGESPGGEALGSSSEVTLRDGAQCTGVRAQSSGMSGRQSLPGVWVLFQLETLKQGTGVSWLHL